MGIGTLRRHYTQRTVDEPREAATPSGATSMAPLPEGFPYRDRLEAVGYRGLEELRAASEEELIARGLTRRQAARVIEALQELG